MSDFSKLYTVSKPIDIGLLEFEILQEVPIDNVVLRNLDTVIIYSSFQLSPLQETNIETIINNHDASLAVPPPEVLNDQALSGSFGIPSSSNPYVTDQDPRLEPATIIKDGLMTSEDKSNLDEHLIDVTNPHGVTKDQIGLSNVDNTSDMNKPVSTSQQAAINNAQSNAESYADGLISSLKGATPESLDTLQEISQALQNNPDVIGDVLNALAKRVRVDVNDQGLSATEKNNAKMNLSLENVDNTSDANKPISSATQTALNNKENSFVKNTAFNKNFGSSIQTTGVNNSAGTGENVARDNHVHDHGNQSNENHHAAVTQSLNGFMSKDDKIKLDSLHLGDMIGLACEGDPTYQITETTFSTVPLITTTFENRPEYVDRNGNQIRIKTTGLYLVIYKMNMIQTAQTSTYEAQLLLNGATVMDSSSSRNTNYNGEHCPTSITTLQYLTANDYFELQARRTTTNDLTAVTPPHVVVIKMEGYKGEKGDPGPSIVHDLVNDVTTRTNTARSYDSVSILDTYPTRNVLPNGVYKVSFKIKYTVAATNNTFRIALFKDGNLISSTEQIWRVNVSGTNYRYQYQNYSIETYVNNTTTFDLRAYSASTTITIYESEILLERLS